MSSVLIVDDEEDIRELISMNLNREGFEVIEAEDGINAVKIARKSEPDLVILDLMLPEKDGYTVYQELRQDTRTSDIPVLMLTARGKLDERLKGLSMGADDYITKPFSPKELVLRVRNVLKRIRQAPASAVVEINDFRLDKNNLKLHLKGEEVDLTATEFKLLLILIESPNVTKERSELLQKVWGYNDMIQTRTLDTHIKRLREKLDGEGQHIETVRGVGYRFSVDKA